MQPFSFFFLVIRCGAWGGDFGSGSGSKFNCAARVGSVRVGLGQTISGTGRVRASVLSPCRPLLWATFTLLPQVIMQVSSSTFTLNHGFMGYLL